MRFVDRLRWAARAAGDHPATVHGERIRTWAMSVDRVARLAGVLRDMGGRRGTTIGILAANSDLYLELIHACWWIGAVPVPMNVRWVLAEHVDATNDAGLAILFADAAAAGLAADLRRACPSLRHVVAIEAIDGLIADRAPVDADPASDHDPAGIFYTGGATGRSKGVVHSAASLWAAATIGARGLRIPERPVYLHAAPMFHLGGLMPAFMTTATAGTHVFAAAFRPATVAEAVRTAKVDFTALVPVMIAMLVDDDMFRPADYASLRVVQYGGGAISSDLRERLGMVLPAVRFEQGYGQSEVGGGVSTMRHEVLAALTADDPRRGSAGRVHDGVKIIVTDDIGDTVLPGTVGEFRICSPGAMTGYLDRPAETRAALVDGWVRTGDAGYIDADGFIFVCDRLKDVVRPGGENVFSAEVENALLSHPAVAAVAVIAVPDERWEERVHAVVTVRGNEAPTLAALQAHCRERIAGYKIPRSLEVIATMPLSGAGKILKAALREPHWRGRARLQR